jgi:hypothetical protein
MKEQTYCRNCRSSFLVTKLDLGEIYPSNFVDGNNNLVKAPLVLAQCSTCNLVQLKHTLPLDSMYRQYWYRSALNSSMVEALKDVVDSATQRVKLENGNIVLDIGCNDGTMLDFYPDTVIKVGFDPALNLAAEAIQHCHVFVNDYFSGSKYANIMNVRAMIVTSIAMFYDLEDPNQFVYDVRNILHPDGLWVIQFTDLLSMLKLNAFDNICHEHLEYYSLEVLNEMLDKHYLQIIAVERNKVNGGSLRVYVSHKHRYPVEPSVQKHLDDERNYMSRFDDPLSAFAERVENIRGYIKTYLTVANHSGKKIAVFGASTKGNTLLQVFDLDYRIIDHAAEINKDKLGLKTVGTSIPIISQDESLLSKPDIYLVLPWHFINNFVTTHIDYLKSGGIFVVPMPEPRMVTNSGWYLLDGIKLSPPEAL